MAPYPNANVVSRALKRDAGITTTPRNRAGFHVTGNGDYPARVHVDIDDAPGISERVKRTTRHLVETLTAHGWTVSSDPDGDAITVQRVPTVAETRAQRATASVTVSIAVDKATWMDNYGMDADAVQSDVRTALEQVVDAAVSAWIESTGNVGTVEVKTATE